MKLFGKQGKEAGNQTQDEGYDNDYYGGAFGEDDVIDADPDVNEKKYKQSNDDSRYDVPARKPQSSKASVKLMRPKSYNDAFDIADFVAEGSIVLLDLDSLSKDVRSSMFHFLVGATHVIHGQMIKSGKSSIVVAPEGVDISNFASVSDNNGDDNDND